MMQTHRSTLSLLRCCVFLAALLGLIVPLFILKVPNQIIQEELDYPQHSFRRRQPIIPLEDLVASHQAESQICKDPFVLVNDTRVDPALIYKGGRKIPCVVHVTSMSRCNDKIFADNLETWRLKDHSFFLHDDDAVERLLHRDWPEFPLLRKVLSCLPNKGAIMTDVWRILVLWEYGGIYADMDTSPVPQMFNETTLTADDDAFFVIEQLGTPSQWFMATSPRHPMMYLTMQRIILNLMLVEDLGFFPVVFTTGPGAVKEGFRAFTGLYGKQQYTAGRYVGVMNRTVTLVGNITNQDMYITRVIESVKNTNVKNSVYQKMGMTHLTHMGLKDKKWNVSCLQRMYEEEEHKHLLYEPSWTTTSS